MSDDPKPTEFWTTDAIVITRAVNGFVVRDRPHHGYCSTASAVAETPPRLARIVTRWAHRRTDVHIDEAIDMLLQRKPGKPEGDLP